MAKIYSKKTLASKDLKPKKEVVSFLLSYSQALKVVNIDNKSFEISLSFHKKKQDTKSGIN